MNVLSKMNLFLRIILPLIHSRACVLKEHRVSRSYETFVRKQAAGL